MTWAHRVRPGRAEGERASRAVPRGHDEWRGVEPVELVLGLAVRQDRDLDVDRLRNHGEDAQLRADGPLGPDVRGHLCELVGGEDSRAASTRMERGDVDRAEAGAVRVSERR